MKIILDISQIIYEGTGVSTYSNSVVESLLKYTNIEVVLFGSSLRQYEVLKNHVKRFQKIRPCAVVLHKLPQRILSLLWNDLHIVPIEIFTGKANLVHTSDWIEAPSHLKKVTTIQDMVIYKYPETSDTEIIHTQKKRIGHILNDKTNIVTSSLSSREDISSILGIAKERIEVIYPGIESVYRPQTQDKIRSVKRKYNIHSKYILSVGTLEPRKNIKTAVHSFENFRLNPSISSQKSSVEMLLVGKQGWQEEFTLPSYVRRLGYVPTEDLVSLYSGSEMFLYPSLYEGFGFPILEAMACNTPVITSNRGSLKEIAGSAAMFVNPLDPDEITNEMVKLFTNVSQREKVRQMGVKQAQKFNWKTTALQLQKVYSSYQ